MADFSLFSGPNFLQILISKTWSLCIKFAVYKNISDKIISSTLQFYFLTAGAVVINTVASIKMIEDAEKALRSCQRWLSEAETNFRSAQTKLEEKRELKQTMSRYLKKTNKKLREIQGQIAEYRMKSKAIAECQKSIKETLPILLRVETSIEV